MGDNMCIKAFAKYLRSALQRFGTNERGNVVFIFALATVPMIGFVGAAVDYSNANSVKSAMQTAADSTALMLSKDAQNLTTAQLNTKATEYLQCLVPPLGRERRLGHPDVHQSLGR